MSYKSFLWLLIIVLVAFGAWKSTTILNENQQMIVTRFGRLTQEPITAPGLHLTLPFLSDKYIYPKNLIDWHSAVAEMPTKDDKFIAVESFALWKISDPVLFNARIVTLEAAERRLSDLLDGTLRDEVARHTLAELVRSSGRRMDVTEINDILKVPEKKTLFQTKGRQPEIVAAIYRNAVAALDSMQLGIQLVDFDLKSVNFIRVIE
jgi:membrane protease subunit HflC